ncbi:hypothetical protein VdG1_01299 [Verticillium dahliae VDG1]|nr:hypothetical protein VdG1_01299 [Verticillium dahliae VDG1]
MGSSRNAVPDAWEDDWETQADKQEAQPTQEAPPPAPMTKAERRAQHAETNRKLWESADTRETFHFVEATSNVPLASTFKPQVKVLSRKPPPTVARRHQQQQQDEGARRPGSRPETPRSGAETRELYDPNFAPKPGFALQRRGDGSAPQSGRNSPKDLQEQPRPAIRAPRGPDGSGRGGFGFARRGSKEA